MNPYSLDSYLPTDVLLPKMEAAFGSLISQKDSFSWQDISQFGFPASFMDRMSFLLLADFPDLQIAGLVRTTQTLPPEGIKPFLSGIRQVYFNTLSLSQEQVTKLITRQIQADLVFKLAPQVVADQLLFAYGPSIEYNRFIELIEFLPEDYDLKEILLNYAEAKPQSEYMKTKISRNMLIILQNLRKDEPAEFFADQLRQIADEIGIFEIEAEALKAYAQMIPDPFVEKRIEHYLFLENLSVIDIERASGLLLGELESGVKTTTLNLDFSLQESEEAGSEAFGELRPKFTTSQEDKPFSPFFDMVGKTEQEDNRTELPLADQKPLPFLAESEQPAKPVEDYNQPENLIDEITQPELNVEPVQEISLFDRIIQETRQDIALAVMEQIAKPEPLPEPEPESLSETGLPPETISLFDAIIQEEPKRPEPINLDAPPVVEENFPVFTEPVSSGSEELISTKPFYTPLEQMMSESQARGFIKHIFRKNETRFYASLTDLNNMSTWDESKGYIEQIYKEFNVDLYSNEAIEFTDLVYSRYTL
ncbi:MAG: hypothetical protein J0L62_05270 [Bacteroidetes bacterium]|nr:hypothetical protein [Bacteroidota bacterium]